LFQSVRKKGWWKCSGQKKSRKVKSKLRGELLERQISEKLRGKKYWDLRHLPVTPWELGGLVPGKTGVLAEGTKISLRREAINIRYDIRKSLSVVGGRANKRSCKDLWEGGRKRKGNALHRRVGDRNEFAYRGLGGGAQPGSNARAIRSSG